MKVYVAGPISKGNIWKNIKMGIETSIELIRMGHAPYTPHLNFVQALFAPDIITWEQCLQLDEIWLAQCDCMFRIPGESKGADREEAYARAHGIPVYYTLAELEKGGGKCS